MLYILKIIIKLIKFIKRKIYVILTSNNIKKNYKKSYEYKNNFNYTSNNEKNYIKGEEGEQKVINYLYKDNSYYKKILNNLYLPINEENFEYGEIDILLICSYGIFCFEIKNYSGWIFGNRKDNFWNQNFRNKKFQFYNPIMQNKKHIALLKENLKIEKYNLYKSIVLFTGNAKIKSFIENKNNDYILTEENIFRLENIIKENNIEILSIEEINNIYENLKKYTNVSEVVKLNHINRIKSKNF